MVVLTEVGRGARYSGVMYLSATLEIILSRSLTFKCPDSSRMVMRSNFAEVQLFKQLAKKAPAGFHFIGVL